MTKAEARQLADYLDKVNDNVPIGMGDLKDVLTFAVMDIRSFIVSGREGRHFGHAVTFAKSIPQFTDFESDKFASWVIHDEAYADYICRTNL